MASMPQRLGRARPLVTISHWIHSVQTAISGLLAIKTTINRFHQPTEGLEDRNLSCQAVAAWQTDYQMAIQYHHDIVEAKRASCERKTLHYASIPSDKTKQTDTEWTRMIQIDTETNSANSLAATCLGPGSCLFFTCPGRKRSSGCRIVWNDTCKASM